MSRSFDKTHASKDARPPADRPRIGVPVVVGMAIIGLFFGIFGVWAAVAPLQSAAIAPGVVSVESQRKTIQHLEGGIVAEILVRDGDEVAAGDVLVVLDETQARARLQLLRGRYRAAQALEARLVAERDGLDVIAFPEAMVDAEEDVEVAGLVESQTNIFNARRRSLQGQTAIMEQRVAQIREEIRGLEGQTAAQSEQLELTSDEIESVQELFERGMSGKSPLRELQRELAEVTGAYSQNVAAIARAEQNIGEAYLEIEELETRFLNEVVQELEAVRTETFDLSEQIRSAEDVLRRTSIRAPISGSVVDLQVHTVGGVIAPGQQLLDIVPRGERLVVEAFVDPNDIDVVEIGLPAKVYLTALSLRNTLAIDGHVETVSADRLTDRRTGADYFLARVVLADDLSSVLEQEELYPGMQAEVMIVTGARTTLDYLSRPIVRSLNRAFREQ